MSLSKSTAIGIDLGTTYCCVAVYCHNAVSVIANNHGNRTTPSYVALDEDLADPWLVGETAKNQASYNIGRTAYNAKRLIGQSVNEPDLAKDLKNWTFKVVPDTSGMAKIELQGQGGPKSVYPEDISSKLLKYMKQIAETYLGTEVKNAVITVPANFNNAQREATLRAGRKAGLNVLQLLNEPTAAAIAYGQHLHGEQSIMVFDFGGGTLDVSILKVKDGKHFEVLSTSGDTHLGGEDLDARLVKHVAEDFQRKHNFDLCSDPKKLQKLRVVCDEAKRALSKSKSTKVLLENAYGEKHLEQTVTRETFEQLCADIFKLVTVPVEKALELAQVEKHAIDEVILAGGSSKIPKVQEILRQFFNGKQLQASINPDEAISVGAALHAISFSDSRHGLAVVEKVALSLGTKTGYLDRFFPIVQRGNRIPATGTRGFTTLEDHQQRIGFKVYEGDRPLADDNYFLGQCTLEIDKPELAGEPDTEVTLHVDINGIMQVTAKDKKSGRLEKLEIACGNRLDADGVSRSLKNVQSNEAADKRTRDSLEAFELLQTYMHKVRDARRRDEVVRKRAEGVGKNVLAWFEENKRVLQNKSVYAEKLAEAKGIFDTVLQ